MYSTERSTSEFTVYFMGAFKQAPPGSQFPIKSYGKVLNHEFMIIENRNSFEAHILRNKKKFYNIYDMGRWIHKTALGDEKFMFIEELRDYVIRPALTIVGLWSESAEILLAGTIMVESGGVSLKQIGGPALGLYQIEPLTHKDFKRDLDKPENHELKFRILRACGMDEYPLDDALVWNLRYATLVARVKYRMSEEPLPDANNAAALATYHKIHYNSRYGKAIVTKNTDTFKRLIHA